MSWRQQVVVSPQSSEWPDVAGIDAITRLVHKVLRLLTHVSTSSVIFSIVEEASHMSDTIKTMI
jgi:hypothetical protein